MVMIVKRDGRIEEYSKDKLIRILNTKHNTIETLAIIDLKDSKSSILTQTTLKILLRSTI